MRRASSDEAWASLKHLNEEECLTFDIEKSFRLRQDYSHETFLTESQPGDQNCFNFPLEL